MAEERQRKILFEHNFQNMPIQEAVSAYLNKYKVEGRYSFSTYFNAHQQGDTACVKRALDSVGQPIYVEEICFTRGSKNMSARLIIPFKENIFQVPEKNHLQADGNGTKLHQEVFQTDGDKEWCLTAFKKSVENMYISHKHNL